MVGRRKPIVKRADKLRVGDVIRVADGRYKAGETNVTITRETWCDSPSRVRYMVNEWDVWTVKFRRSDWVEVIG